MKKKIGIRERVWICRKVTVITKEKTVAFLMMFVGVAGIIMAVLAKPYFVYKEIGKKADWDELNIVVSCVGENERSYLTQKQIRKFADLGKTVMTSPVYSFPVIISCGESEQKITLTAVSGEWLAQYIGSGRSDSIPLWGNCFIDREGAKSLEKSETAIEGMSAEMSFPGYKEPFSITMSWMPSIKDFPVPISDGITLFMDIDYLMWILETYYPYDIWPGQEKTLTSSELESMRYTGAVLVADTITDVMIIHERIGENGYECRSMKNSVQENLDLCLVFRVACASGGVVMLLSGIILLLQGKHISLFLT